MVAFDSQYRYRPENDPTPPAKEVPGKNRLIEYELEWTPNGTWKRFDFSDGRQFAEYTSHRTLLGKPLLHYVSGVDPETNRVKTARGFIAIGRKAVGIIAIGQYARGFIAIGQLAIGILAFGQCALGLTVGIGQLGTGALALGQLAIGGVVAGQFAFGAFFAAGQFAVAWTAIGGACVGYFAYGVQCAGKHVWDRSHADPQAIAVFTNLFRWW
jgi:hypothetical protein